MTDHDTTSRDSIDTYLAVTALVLEGRRHDTLNLIGSLEPEEQIEMWIAGCSITSALSLHLAGTLGIPAQRVPAWLRAMAADNGDTNG
ncbi:hypothetical protein [Williamsia sp. DF01-3]|uniref:hypothetical protein n=1 Tax=Williamsia sp. DF01-3 TaxID=2934157 RepID=UPI001FF53DB7|nr:hypothetical protein [Williamsia sp. DF01-3]MCK0518942.1 hypothetical protein [Williamsia sp. DF01-3]